MTGYIASMRAKVGHDRILTVSAGVIVYKEGCILLQKRKDNGFWSDHGGSVEFGEQLEDTARRELWEETGLTAHRLEFFKVYSGPDLMYTYPNGDKVCNVATIWLCEDFSGTPVAQPEEVSALRWFALDDLPDSLFPPIRKPLREVVNYLRHRNGFA